MNILTEIAAYSLLHALQTAADPALNELAANATLRAAARRVELTAPRLPSWAPPETAEETLTRAIRYTLLRALALAAAPAIIELSRAVEGGKLTVPAACRRLRAALPDFSTLAADVLARLEPSDPVTAAAKRCRSKNPAHCRVHGVPLKKPKKKQGGTITKSPTYQRISTKVETVNQSEQILARLRDETLQRDPVKANLRSGIKGKGAKAGVNEPEFFITRTSIKKLTHSGTIKKSADTVSHHTAAAHIMELWRTSYPIETGKHRDSKRPYNVSEIEWIHRRVAYMQIGKEKYEVKMTAKEFKHAKPDILYCVQTRKIKKRDA